MQSIFPKTITGLGKKKPDYQQHLVVLCEQLEDAVTAKETDSANEFFRQILAAVRNQQKPIRKITRR